MFIFKYDFFYSFGIKFDLIIFVLPQKIFSNLFVNMCFLFTFTAQCVQINFIQKKDFGTQFCLTGFKGTEKISI
ncbi:MAG: hypothetical protein EAZ57_07525 [Cytophagales bacterium]|nr:MAG: hypothetical protein EAZ67_08610 [Cytophagales bacterium]TAF60388.1 MAG: hypothetical protein EAZ57_07525 [Cytophagales bacterium]